MTALYLAQLFLGMIIAVFAYSMGNAEAIRNETLNIEASSAIVQVFLLVMIILMQLALYAIFKRKIPSLKENFMPGAGVSAYSLFIILGVMCLWAMLSSGEYSSDDSDLSAFALSAIFIFGAAAVEELLFRGIFFKALARKYEGRLFLVVALHALLFTMVHWNNPDFQAARVINIFLMSVLMGLAALKSLGAVIIFHFLWNFTSGYIFGVSVSGYKLKNTVFHAEMTAWEDTYVLTALAVLALAFILYRNYREIKRPANE